MTTSPPTPETTPSGAGLAPEGASPALPPLAHPLRRLGAFLTDLLIWFALGELVGWGFWQWTTRLGPYGHLLGWVLLVLYLAWGNSHGRQTWGQRALHLAVRDAQGRPLGFGRALLRATILTLPWLVSGQVFVPLQRLWLGRWWIALFNPGVALALFYTFLFNLGARQAIHDLLTGSYVVQLGAREPFPYPVYPHTAPGHRWFVGIILLTLPPFLALHTPPRPISPPPAFFAIGARVYTDAQHLSAPPKTVYIQTWHKGPLPENEAQRKQLAQQAVEAVAQEIPLAADTRVVVTLSAHFDLYFAAGSRHYTITYSGFPEIQP